MKTWLIRISWLPVLALQRADIHSEHTLRLTGMTSNCWSVRFSKSVKANFASISSVLWTPQTNGTLLRLKPLSACA